MGPWPGRHTPRTLICAVGLLVLLHVALAADGDAADATSTATETTEAFFTLTTSTTSPSSESTPAPTSSTPLASTSETSGVLVSSTSLAPSSTPASTSYAAPTTIAAASTEGVVLSTTAAPDAGADTTAQGTSPPRATPRPALAYPVEKEVAGARVRVLGEFEFELPAGGVAGLAQGHVLQIKPPKATVRRAAGADESFAAVLQQVMGLTITLPSGAWPSEAVEIPSAGPTGPWATNASVLLLRGTLFFIKPDNLNLAQGAVISLPVDRQVSRQAGNPNNLTQMRLAAHGFQGATWRHLGGELRKGVDTAARPHDVLVVTSRELGALAVFQSLLIGLF